MALAEKAGTDPPEKAATIMFTDLAEFTAFKEKVGERAAVRVLREHDAIVFAAVGEHGGNVLKSLGDGFLVHFPTVAPAVEAAVKIQQRTAIHNQKKTEKQHRIPPIRVGISFGDVICLRRGREEDLLGTTVDKAFRICNMTEGDHVFVNAAQKGELKRWLRERIRNSEIAFGRTRRVPWKGGGEELTPVAEILYKRPPSGKFILEQTEIFVPPDVVRTKAAGYKLAIKLINSSRQRVLIATRTLPVLTGPTPGDDGDRKLKDAICRKLRSRKSRPKVCLMYSIKHTRKCLMARKDTREREKLKAQVMENLRELVRTAKTSRGRVELRRMDELHNPLVVSDHSYALWMLFETIEGNDIGVGLKIMSKPESTLVWNRALRLCKPEENDLGRLAAEIGLIDRTGSKDAQ